MYSLIYTPFFIYNTLCDRLKLAGSSHILTKFMDAQRRTALIFVTQGVGCASCMCDWVISDTLPNWSGVPYVALDSFSSYLRQASKSKNLSASDPFTGPFTVMSVFDWMTPILTSIQVKLNSF